MSSASVDGVITRNEWWNRQGLPVVEQCRRSSMLDSRSRALEHDREQFGHPHPVETMA
ncbi:MAG: hypothetical protein WBM50_28355 [Acidimicrobiales bacterium]